MDFMFEDDVDEVGSDVEAYCPKCKADTTHVVISKYEDEIRRVQCNPCGDVHSFRKPRGEAEEDMPEPVAARKRALLKKQTWEEFFAKHGERNTKPYEFRDTYRENAILFHPKFGKGYVSEVVSESKVEITFSDARRILVHNRKDIPGSPVGREDDGLPSTAAPAKAKGATKAAEKKAVDKPAAKPVVAPKTDPAPKLPGKKLEEKNAPGKKLEDKKPDEKKAPAKKPVDKHPAAKNAPAVKKPVAPANKPADKKPEAKKPEAKKPEAKKPAAKKPAGKKPAKKKSK
jgi:Zn ribbon nucleic-acid-binding protein